MKYVLLTFAAVLCLSAQPAVQTLPAVPQELLGKAVAHASHTRVSVAAAVNPSTVIGDNYELAITSDAPLTVPPGQFVPLPQSQLDFSGATHASIAVQSADVNLTGLRVLAAWAAPGTWFNITEMSQSASFPVLDHGGIFTPAYGPALKIYLYNSSAAPLLVKQISVYATK